MAKQDIKLTVGTQYNGEGMRKLDQDIRSTAKSAKTASDGIRSVTNALGSLDGKAGKAAGAISGILNGFARGGIWGVAIAAIGAAFSYTANKLKELREAGTKAAKEITDELKKAFDIRLNNLDVDVQLNSSKMSRQQQQETGYGSAYDDYQRYKRNLGVETNNAISKQQMDYDADVKRTQMQHQQRRNSIYSDYNTRLNGETDEDKRKKLVEERDSQIQRDKNDEQTELKMMEVMFNQTKDFFEGNRIPKVLEKKRASDEANGIKWGQETDENGNTVLTLDPTEINKKIDELKEEVKKERDSYNRENSGYNADLKIEGETKQRIADSEDEIKRNSTERENLQTKRNEISYYVQQHSGPGNDTSYYEQQGKELDAQIQKLNERDEFLKDQIENDKSNLKGDDYFSKQTAIIQKMKSDLDAKEAYAKNREDYRDTSLHDSVSMQNTLNNLMRKSNHDEDGKNFYEQQIQAFLDEIRAGNQEITRQETDKLLEEIKNNTEKTVDEIDRNTKTQEQRNTKSRDEQQKEEKTLRVNQRSVDFNGDSRAMRLGEIPEEYKDFKAEHETTITQNNDTIAANNSTIKTLQSQKAQLMTNEQYDSEMKTIDSAIKKLTSDFNKDIRDSLKNHPEDFKGREKMRQDYELDISGLMSSEDKLRKQKTVDDSRGKAIDEEVAKLQHVNKLLEENNEIEKQIVQTKKSALQLERTEIQKNMREQLTDVQGQTKMANLDQTITQQGRFLNERDKNRDREVNVQARENNFNDWKRLQIQKRNEKDKAAEKKDKDIDNSILRAQELYKRTHDKNGNIKRSASKQDLAELKQRQEFNQANVDVDELTDKEKKELEKLQKLTPAQLRTSSPQTRARLTTLQQKQENADKVKKAKDDIEKAQKEKERLQDEMAKRRTESLEKIEQILQKGLTL